MPQAIVDPEALRQFAGALRAFTEDLQHRRTVLSAQMETLSQSWRDVQHHRFATEFDEQLQQLSRLIGAADQHVPYLLKKADQIDAYLRG